jgi:hypothetical protein
LDQLLGTSIHGGRLAQFQRLYQPDPMWLMLH